MRAGIKITKNRLAFSLVELLVVLAIVSILFSLVAMTTKGTISSFDLSTITNRITDVYSRAREQSITLNESVQVRIYEKDDVYTEVATGIIDPETLEFKQLRTSFFLPDYITILEDYSNLVEGESSLNPDEDLTISEGTADIDGETFEYTSVTFTPNSRVRLATQEPNNGQPIIWTLTFALKVDADNSSGLPSNFTVIQLDPNTARVKVIQPQ